MRIRHFGLVALLSTLALTAQAESAIRAGIGVGKANMDLDGVSDYKGEATAWEIFGGWELNQYLAAEAGYIDLGTMDDEVGAGVLEFDIRAWQASVLGSWWFTDAFGVYGRAGMLKWKSEAESRIGGTVVASGDDDGTDPYFGAGIATNLDGALLRLEYRMAEIEDSNLDLLSLSVVWRF